MSETIQGVIEKAELVVKDADTDLKSGNALECRRNAIKNFVGLGPPDFVVVYKTFEPSTVLPPFLAGSEASTNYYHWALGVNTSSIASITSYFGELVSNQEKKLSILGSLATKIRGIFKIDHLIFSAYNAFARKDLTVEMVSNIDVDAYYLNDEGKRVRDIPESFWHEVYLSSMLRYIYYTQERNWKTLRKISPVNIKPSLQTLEEDETFFQLATECFWKGHCTGINELGAVPDACNNLLTRCILDYLEKRNRYEKMAQFFQQFVEKDPSLNLFLARAQSQSRLPKEAKETLEKAGNSVYVLREKIRFLIEEGKWEEAKNLTTELISLNSALPKSHLLMARIQFHLGEHEKALHTLNSIDIPTDPQTAGDIIGIPRFSHITSPAVSPLPSVHQIAEEEEHLSDREEGEKTLLILDAVNLTHYEMEMYEIVVEMVNTMTWQKVFEIKNQMFKSKPKRLSVRFGTSNSEAHPEPVSAPAKLEDENSSSNKEVNKPVPDTLTVEVKSESTLSPSSNETATQETVAEKNEKGEVAIEVAAVQFRRMAVNESAEELSTHLERVFSTLLHDLRAYFQYKESIDKNDKEVIKRLIPIDWVRLGLLSKRLGHEDEAVRLFESCSGPNWHVRAWQELLLIYKKQRRHRELLLVADHLVKHYTEKYSDNVELHPSSINALYDLVSDIGLSKTRSLLKTAFSTSSPTTTTIISKLSGTNLSEAHPRVSSVLLDSVQWHCFGYDK